MIKPFESIRHILKRINGRGYKAYKDLKGTYRFSWFLLAVDHIQGDPFAALSRFTFILPMEKTGIPKHFWSNQRRKIALTDFLTRSFKNALRPFSKICGTGHSGRIEIQIPSQVILERNSVVIKENNLEVRFCVGLPASGRTILGEKAEKIICEYIPKIAMKALLYENLPKNTLNEHVFSYEDQEILRDKLKTLNLVAFIPNGAILPRKSGVEDTPLPNAVPFMAPKEAEITIELPFKGKIIGMGIPKGITLITGGGFHGKSTLLKAIQEGSYSHIPGDGREYVVSLIDTVKIKAEEGRRIEKVDISPFINDLPFQKDTKRFSTDNASGSTSQAANIMEAIEIGTHLLLLDEDTSATNFMIRDKRMQTLVGKDKEPITPFIDRVRELYTKYNISTILVMGGCGDYLDVADCVIMMIDYQPSIVTQKAKEIARKYQTNRKIEISFPFYLPTPRIPYKGINPKRGAKLKIAAKSVKNLTFGKETIDLSANEQIKEVSQVLAIGYILNYYAQIYLSKSYSLKEVLEKIEKEIDIQGLDSVLPYRAGNLSRPRKHEIAYALNRLRSLEIK